jgi:Mg-chelatase subunit ChlD
MRRVLRAISHRDDRQHALEEVSMTYRTAGIAIIVGIAVFAPAAAAQFTDSITTPNISYVVNFTDDNPYAPPPGPMDDLNFMPTAQAQAMADSLDNNNMATPGNPNGSHAGYVGLGFSAADFNGAALSINVFDCMGGCDNGNAPADRINMPATNFIMASEPCLRRVLGHELFHHVQYAYITFNKWTQWGNEPVEGTARMMEDKVFSDIDADICPRYLTQVNSYLGNPNRDLWTLSYSTALFWSYLTEQLGTAAAEPSYGTDFIRRFWELAQANNSSPDTVGIVRQTIAEFDNEETLENLFHDFAIANAAKEWDVSSLDDATKYLYLDEQDGNGTVYDPVSRAFSGMVQPLVGPNPSSVVRWGAQYYEGILGNDCTGIVGFLADAGSDTAGWGLLTLDTQGRVRHLSKGTGSRFVRSFIQSRIDPYERLIAIAAGDNEGANFDFTFACGQAKVEILRPLQSAPAYVGDAPDPEPFQVRLLITGPTALGSPTVEGLDPSDIDVFVGPSNDPANQATVVSGYRVQGEYWLVVDPPAKAPGSVEDLRVQLRDLTSDVEPDAVIYEDQIIDQVLVIDRSGSMLSPPASPKLDAAKNAATLYVDGAQSDDQIGVVQFGGDNIEPNEDAQLLQQLKPATVGQKTMANGKISGIMTDPAVLTSIGDGMERARQEFVARGHPIGEDWIVLLSDGMENEARFWSSVKPGIIAAGIKVETIALGPETDETLLQAIAADTGGDYYYVDVGSAAPLTTIAGGAITTPALPNRLADAYALAGEQVEDRQRIWETEGEETGTNVLDVDVTEDGIEDGQIAFNWARAGDQLAVEIRRPDGSTLVDGVGGVEIREGPTHSVARVPTLEPGVWRIVLTAVGGTPDYIGIISGQPRKAARMQLYLAAVPETLIEASESVFLRGIPMPIVATLTDSGGAIEHAVVEATVEHPDGTTILLPLFDDGAHDDSNAGDGIYANVYTRTTEPDQVDGQHMARGSYSVVARASGETNDQRPFNRIRKLSFKVSEGPTRRYPTPDKDGDTMPTRYEDLHACLDGNIFDGADDPDDDRIPSRDEWRIGTDPCHPDTDRGGESDRSELGRGANPFDPRDDAIPLPIYVSVVTEVPDHGPRPPLVAEANLIRYPVNPAYEEISLRRSLSPAGPFPEVARFRATDFDGLFLDGGLTNNVTYYYRLVGIGPTGAESAPSHVFGGTPKLDPFAPIGGVDIQAGAPIVTSSTVDLSLHIDDASGVAVMLSNDASFAGAVWQPYAATVSGWLLNPNPSSHVAQVFAKFRDAALNVSTTYSDDVLVLPPAQVGRIRGAVQLDDGAPPVGVRIAAVAGPPGSAPSYAGASGAFAMPDLRPGTYALRCEHGGYAPVDLPNVVVTAAAETDVGTVTLMRLAPSCPGDCGGDGHVGINELILAVNIALGNAAIGACSAADTNHDGALSINELIAAVNGALEGC